MHPVFRSAPPSSTAMAAVVATTATVSAGAALAFSKAPNTTETEADGQSNITPPSYKIEADLMDKIAAKYYIQQRNPHPDKRPKGVPKTMRILAIDLPEMRQAFDGECRVNLKRVFPDGTAPSKLLYGQDNDKKSSVEIFQKSLAQSLVKCRNAKSKRVGVELLEASVAELNPHNLRKTHKFGNYWYDPGKFALPSANTKKMVAEEEPSPASTDDVDENNQDHDDTKKVTPANRTRGARKRNNAPVEMVLATDEDELDAPWNQYAWIEELQTRVSGRVLFGAPMERSSRLSHILYGNVYRQRVPSSRKLYEWFLPPFFQRDPSGVEGDRLNWASHKPHAVIAHGAAMQRVPGSMKLLSDCCKEAQVPLFIIHDPRAWGINTHKDLTEALRDMRHTIKGRIVSAVLEEQGGAFTRGRIVGQMETDARWQAKELQRKAQDAIRDANNEYLRGRENDWSRLDAEALKARLVEHKVIKVHKAKQTEDASSSKATTEKSSSWWPGWRRKTRGDHEESFTASYGMLQLAKECIRTVEKRDVVKEDEEGGEAENSGMEDVTKGEEEVAGVAGASRTENFISDL